MSLNDELANDRTFLAWLRTAIALFALGFVVAKIAYLIDTDPRGLSNRDLYTIVGVVIVVCGAATILVGLWQHRAVNRSISPGGGTAQACWPLVISLVAVAGSLFLCVLIIVSS